MVIVQPSSSHQDRLLVGSNLADADAARHEVEAWLAKNRCFVPRNTHQLSVFEGGVFIREWVLAQRCPEETPWTPLARLLQWTGNSSILTRKKMARASSSSETPEFSTAI